MSRPRIRLRYGSKLFLSHLVAVILVSGSVGTYFYIRAMDNLMNSLRSRLQNSAALLSSAIDVRELEDIRTPDDMVKKSYEKNIRKLRQMRRLNPDIAFLYVMRKEADGLSFVLDSDETEKQAPPGREYTDVPASMLTGFHSPSVDDKLYRDEWGVFLSGYAPLAGGEGKYLVGIDMRADEVDNKLAELRLTGVISLLASLLLALFFALWISKGLSRRIEELTDRFQQIALGRFDARINMRTYDEFQALIGAFNTMAEELDRARRDIDAAMKDLSCAKDGLEQRVLERTSELQKALDQVNVMRGLLPICAACKKIRDDQGYWQQVEVFVEKHTDARFTHGLCPNCMVKYYGDVLSEKTRDSLGIGLNIAADDNLE
ncbi:MAG: HAMP domain-containing protein [Deltaproteobacteria bacterium]|nr:HAMP domain-containing protein [Deltaproteobacteria bacterium]